MPVPLIETDIASGDPGAPAGTLLAEVLVGLQQSPRAIPSKFFYDARGSQLFDRICELEAYYPTRTERAIMERHVAEMVERIGPRGLLVEYGSGSSVKTRILLDHLPQPAGYMPIDISCAHLMQAARALAERYAALPIYPVCADYTQLLELPAVEGMAKTVVFFPGSTIGNFTPLEARAFLQRVAVLCGRRGGGGLLIGVDLKKEPAVLHAAYNDPEGVTAAFNKNVLVRLNRELGADFNVDRFAHYAFYEPVHGRVEMHLVSLADQTVTLGPVRVDLVEGESIRTEYSYKYTRAGFAALAASAGFTVAHVWTDARRRFSVQYLTVA